MRNANPYTSRLPYRLQYLVIPPVRWLLVLLFLPDFLLLPVQAQELAFPEAKGWAATTPGGRGGRIVKVTSLAAEGKGSFLEAINSTGPRIIVFETGGIIDLKGQIIAIEEPFVTIAGQTAPAPGITFIDGGIAIKTHDVVMRHIRIRTGASRHTKGWDPDGMATVSAQNVIIDHCTFTWAIDENCSASGPRFEGKSPEEWRNGTSRNITISNNIIAECLSKATHPKGEHSKGTLIHDNATNILITGNLYASNVDRNALFKGGARGIQANNYIYNPGKNAIRFLLVPAEWEGYPQQTGELTIVGNAMQLGPSSSDIALVHAGNGPCKIYMEDNIAMDIRGQSARLYAGDTTKLVSKKPVWIAGLDLRPASEVKDYVLSEAGARPWDRDEHDTRIVTEVGNGTGKIINSENEVGGYPKQVPTRRKFHAKEWNLKYMIRK